MFFFASSLFGPTFLLLVLIGLNILILVRALPHNTSHPTSQHDSQPSLNIEPRRYNIPNSQYAIDFQAFHEMISLEDGDGLFLVVRGQIVRDLNNYGRGALVEHGYWAVDEPPLELFFESIDPLQHPHRVPPLTYGVLAQAIEGLSRFFPYIRTRAFARD